MKQELFAVTLLLLALLSGCACEHEWTQPDCLTPAVCTKCEASGAEALGHDWTEATCTEAETCARCGETRSEALGHSFGDWLFGEDHMTRVCTACSLEETTELDRGLYLEDLLSGRWEFCGMIYGEEFYSAYQFSTPGDTMFFSQERSFSGVVNQEDFAGIWEFQEYQQEDGTERYYFSAQGENGTSREMLYLHTADEDLLYIFFGGDTQIILCRNDAIASAVAGSWGAETETGMFSLTFHEDRTVTGTLDQEITGTWQLLPLRDYYGTSTCGMYICFTRDSEDVVLMAGITPSYSSDTEDSGFVPGCISFRYNDEYPRFEPMDPAELAFQTFAAEAGPQAILGNWTSKYVQEYDPTAGTNEKTVTTESSITFHEDGTFTGFHGGAVSGAWTHYNSTGTEESPCYYYRLLYQGQTDYVYAQISGGSGRPRLSIASYIGTGSSTVYLEQMTQEELDAYVMGPELPVGSWTSMRIGRSNHDTGFMEYTETSELTFAFHDDGTFTGTANVPMEGTWEYNDYSPSAYNHYSYTLHVSGQEYTETFHIDEDGNLEISMYIDDVYTVFEFSKD